MKKLILALVFLFSMIIVSSQNYVNNYQQNPKQTYVPDSEITPSVNITINQIQNGWARLGTICAGCPSYWYQVTRTQQMHRAEDGTMYYYYFFHFFSNSSYTNGSPAGTYLSQVYFFHNGELIISTPYLLLPVGKHIDGAWMRSKNSDSMVTFTITQMSVH